MTRAIRLPSSVFEQPAKMRRAIKNGMDAAAQGAKADFAAVVNTWETDVQFTVSSPDPFTRVVGTESEVFTFVDRGTRPHIIRARGGKTLVFWGNSKPKTRPRVLRSGSGGHDSTIVYAKQVNHPGTKAREFSEMVAKKWEDELPVTMQRSIDAEV